MLLFAALIRALSAFGAEAPFASFDVSHLCTFPWTSDAGRAGAHLYHRYGIARSNHQTKGGFFAQTLSIRPRSGSSLHSGAKLTQGRIRHKLHPARRRQ